jgi:hypothetical protein
VDGDIKMVGVHGMWMATFLLFFLFVTFPFFFFLSYSFLLFPSLFFILSLSLYEGGVAWIGSWQCGVLERAK